MGPFWQALENIVIRCAPPYVPLQHSFHQKYQIPCLFPFLFHPNVSLPRLFLLLLCPPPRIRTASPHQLSLVSFADLFFTLKTISPPLFIRLCPAKEQSSPEKFSPLRVNILSPPTTYPTMYARPSVVRSSARAASSAAAAAAGGRRAATTHAISNPTLANIEKRWESLPLQEQADLWMSLRDRMKGNWKELTLNEKKAGESMCPHDTHEDAHATTRGVYGLRMEVHIGWCVVSSRLLSREGMPNTEIGIRGLRSRSSHGCRHAPASIDPRGHAQWHHSLLQATMLLCHWCRPCPSSRHFCCISRYHDLHTSHQPISPLDTLDHTSTSDLYPMLDSYTSIAG